MHMSRLEMCLIFSFYVRPGLAASLGYGAASELLRRSTSSDDHQSPSLVLTEAMSSALSLSLPNCAAQR